MGLDIFILTDKKIKQKGIPDSLSRYFVRLILRQHDNNDEEIEQIAEICGIDLTPLLEMELPDTSYLQFQIDFMEGEEGIQKLKQEIEQTNDNYFKDIQLIIDMLQKLDTALKANPDFYSKLALTEPDQDYINYFKNYSVNVEPNEHGLISSSDTNFGVDIRTLLSYLIFAKSQGATKAYFSFG